MKKWRADDFWFELTEGRSPDGGLGFVRYNTITCRKCGTKAQHLACGQSVDQLRKFFIRQNWEIGKSRFHHVCPECAHKHNHRREAEPKPAPSNVIPLHLPARTLIETWDRASNSERAEFLLALETTQGLILARPARAPVPTPDPAATTIYRVIQPGLTHLDYNELITTSELLAVQEKYGSDTFSVKAVDAAKLEAPQKMVDEFLRQVKEHKEEPKEAPVDDGWQQHGHHIDSLPVEETPPPIEHAPVVTAQDDDDDEPADWWQEIMRDKKSDKK